MMDVVDFKYCQVSYHPFSILILRRVDTGTLPSDAQLMLRLVPGVNI